MPLYEFDRLRPQIDAHCFVHPEAVLIGDVVVGPRCFIGPGAVLRGDLGRITVGAGANVQDNCVIHCIPEHDVLLEDDAHIGHGAVLHGCTVGRNALVGIEAVIMDGATIGEEAWVAAMTFVKEGMNVPPRTLAVGVPARILRDLRPDEIENKSHNTAIYHDLARRYRETMRPL